MTKTGKILIGLAGIFAAGVVTGALYAPDKGERTRRRIMSKGNWFLHSAGDAMAEGKDTVDEIRDRLKDNLEQIKNEMDRLSQCSSKA